MALDPVPWFVGHPAAQHSAEVARLLAYAATGGGSGVGAASDARVLPTAVPGPAVRVSPGAIVVPFGNQQSYIARIVSNETVAVAATGSSSGRTDLVCAIIRDPSVAGGGTPPADPVNGPYWELVIISGVPSGTTRLQDVSGHANTTGYALARISLPASTGTVTSSMITDLRQMVVARRSRDLFWNEITSQTDIKSTQTSLIPFPNEEFVVQVPSWAAKAIVRLDSIAEMTAGGGGGGAFITVEYALVVHAAGEVWSEHIKFRRRNRYEAELQTWVPVMVGGEFAVPPEMRGKSVTVKLYAQRNGSFSGQPNLAVKAGSAYSLDVEFEETA